MDYIIKNISPVSSEALKISGDLFIELGQKYGERFIEDYTEVNHSLKYFLVLEINNNITASGALNEIDKKTAEIKRMFVYPEFRGKGFSKIILQELEKIALEKNYKKIRLETGVLQPEAVSLYEKFNYKRIKCYGKFEGDPHSICFEKEISFLEQ